MPAPDVIETAISEVKIVTPCKFGDARGFFSETYSRRDLASAGLDVEFVQDNHSLSAEVGTLRGLHFQAPPCAQGKLVRVARGRIWDVAVDIRRSSPTFGRHVAVELSAEIGDSSISPSDFSMGFAPWHRIPKSFTRQPNIIRRPHDGGVAWDDPDIAIAWPALASTMILSDKDRRQPRLRDLPAHFE